MCECERQLALTFRPHQVQRATEYGTHQRYLVTGFAPRVCAECRGRKEEAHPRAAIYGQKGKVERYYWREIYKTYCGYMLDWLQQNSEQVRDALEFQARFPVEAKEFKKRAKRHWQTENKDNPKYDLREMTESEFLGRVKVPVTKIAAVYQPIDKGGQKIGKWISLAGGLDTVENVAAESYVSRGFSVIDCERKLISTWVATFLARSIQDPSDPRVRQTFRGSTKNWTSCRGKSPIIEIRLPEDFGSAEYYERRKASLQASIAQMSASDNLQGLFDELLIEGESLRDYLWVNNDEVVDSARTVLEVLSKEIVIICVEWAIQSFWDRQPGWPDLFAYNNSDFIFVEVKSPHDELSQEQMRWFQWAIEEAHIPCELCRVEKAPE